MIKQISIPQVTKDKLDALPKTHTSLSGTDVMASLVTLGPTPFMLVWDGETALSMTQEEFNERYNGKQTN